MEYIGEILSLIVAISWTATALFADSASRRLGSLPLNVIRMVLSLVLIGITLWFTVGSPYPAYAGGKAWFWLAMSGFVGYVFGDYCLFNSYIIIGSRFGQLFMTLAPPVAAITSWIFLDEKLPGLSWLAMLVTLVGIGLSILAKGEDGRLSFNLPVKGILFGIGAGIGQGVGLVLSKIGLNFYAADIPTDAPEAMATMMPFAGTFIRAIAGGLGFICLMALRRDFPALRKAVADRKGMGLAFLTTFTGPFIGVSLSLMAVQYAKAGVASTIMALTPVLIIWPHCLIFKKKVTLKEVIGAVISLVGVSLFFV